MKSLKKYFIIGFVIIALVFNLYQMTVSGPRAEKAVDLLGIEIKQINPLPDSKLQDKSIFEKPGIASVKYKYTSQTSWSEINMYYDNELKEKGWYKTKEDLNEPDKYVYYRKGDYTAALVYVADNPKFNYTYSLEIKWGI